jgi:hypothetical protein
MRSGEQCQMERRLFLNHSDLWQISIFENMETSKVLGEIRAAFPELPMPAERELRFHSDGCDQCAYLSEYLHENRNKPVDGPIIRYMHQEMSCLSAKGWAWALPHYLPFCLTPEAEYRTFQERSSLCANYRVGRYSSTVGCDAPVRGRRICIDRRMITDRGEEVPWAILICDCRRHSAFCG